MVTDKGEVIMKKSRQTNVGRPIWEILELIRVFRENNETTKLGLEKVEEFCKQRKIAVASKKSLDDYWYHI